MKTKQLPYNLAALFLVLVFAGFSALEPVKGETGPIATQASYGQLYHPTSITSEATPEVATVVSGTVGYETLPSKARKFLEKHCDGHAVVKCEKRFTSGEFQIQLADGIDFRFDSKGNVIETEAPEGYSLSSYLLKAVVPGKLYRLLIHNGFEQSVEAVYRDSSGYRIEVSDPLFQTVAFDPSGILTLVVNN